MAEIDISGAFNAKGIDDGFRRVEKGMGKLKKSANGNSLAFLEASRAIEDFSVAGMRGALNNIPGIVMNLGLGMGVAGAVSLAAVGMMGLYKWINRVNESAGQLARKEFFKVFADHVYKLQRSKALESIKGQIDAINASAKETSELGGGFVMDWLKRSDEMSGIHGGHSDRMDKIMGKIDPIRALAKQNALMKESFDRNLQATDMLGKSRLQIEEKIAKAKDKSDAKGLKAAERNAMFLKAAIAEATKFVEKGGEDTRELWEKFAEFLDPSFRSGFGNESKADSLISMQATKDRLESKLREAEAEIQKKKEIEEAIKAEITLSQKALEANKKNSKELERQLYLQQEKLGLLKMELEAMLDAELQRIEQESLETRMKPEGYLSAKGLSGRAAGEAQAAMDALNVQREMHSELVQIRKNTARKSFATYGK
jgi:hypothetical protein